MLTDDLLAKVLGLPRNERTRVAEEVLSSLEEPDDEVAEAWADELRRRSREVAEARLQPADWLTAQTEIRQQLERHRAARPSS